MSGRRCVCLGVSYTFDVLLTGFDATVAGGDVSRIGVGMIRSRGCRKKDGLSVVVYNKKMIVDFSKNSGCSLACAHAYLVTECYCEVLTPFSITVLPASIT